MKKMRFVFHLLLYLLSLFLFLHGSNCSVGNPQSEMAEMVNVHIGSISHTLEPTLPTVHLPHGMIRLWPIVSPGAADRYTASRIYAFPLNQPAHRYPPVGAIMPAAGEGEPLPDQIASEFDHALEIAKPYYYSVLLEDDDIWAEYSPTERAVFYQFKFNQSGPAQIFIFAKNNGHFQIIDNKTVVGKETFEGVTQYFYLELNVPFTHFKLYKNQTLQNPEKEISGDKLTAALRYELPAGQTIGVKYGISYISEEQAKQNLKNEIPHWSFEAVKTAAQEKWNSTLAKIQIKGGTPDQRVYFYTALYRCFERMVNITEDGKYYSGYDHQIHEDSRPFYVDDWSWDTYRSLHPLRLLIEPEKEMDMIQSYVRMYEQSGWMPTFPQIWGDRKCMIGHHQAALLADAYFKGWRDFDLQKAYRGLRKNAMEGTMIPWQEGPAFPIDQVYREKGFFPALQPGQKETIESVSSFEQRQSVAVTLEHAYDDWCLAQLAKELDKSTDYDLFMKRAENYKNVYNPATGFMSPKTEDGKWLEPFDPKRSGGIGSRAYFAELNSWTYTWHVQHDVPGLMELMGGKEKFIARLDRLFEESLGSSKWVFLGQFPDATGLVGQFVMGNEQSFHIPYLYNYAGVPWKAQKRIRQLLDAWFRNDLMGVCGDEDGGAMSSFYVFSAMGFYPVCPGQPIYLMGSPLFDEIKIDLGKGKHFIIKAIKNSARNRFIQAAKLNGKEINRSWFTHSEIVNGGELILEMGARPNKSWGSVEISLPASMSTKKK